MIYRFIPDESIYVPNDSGCYTGYFRTLEDQPDYDEYFEGDSLDTEYGEPLEYKGSVPNVFFNNNTNIEELI